MKTLILFFMMSLTVYANADNPCITRQELVARSPGVIESFLVNNGTSVKAGAPIILLDDRLQKATLKEAQGALDLAKAQLELAEDTRKRLMGLKDSESISEQQKFESKIRLAQAKAQLKQAEGAFQRIQAQYEDTKIRAKVSGVVKGLPTMIGIFVQPGMTLGRVEIIEIPQECNTQK